MSSYFLRCRLGLVLVYLGVVVNEWTGRGKE
jgi:hypothetical protein